MKHSFRKPQATFVIPVYNGAAYLAETINACLAQTARLLEIVVVDDGSTDSTPKLMDYFKGVDPKILYFKMPEKVGRSAARNFGIRMATTDILLMLDADDLPMTSRARDTIQFFGKNPGMDLMYGPFFTVDENGIPLEVEEEKVRWHGGEPFSWDRVKETKFTHIGHSTMAFRKKVWETVKYTEGDFSENGIDDWKFQVDAHKAGFKFGVHSALMAQYRVIPKTRDEVKISLLKETCLV